MDSGGKIEDTESEIERVTGNPKENYRGLVEYSKKICGFFIDRLFS